MGTFLLCLGCIVIGYAFSTFCCVMYIQDTANKGRPLPLPDGEYRLTKIK